MASAAVSMKGRALRCLARREHSRAELERRLARSAADIPAAAVRTQIAAVLDELSAQGLLSDERVAAAVLAGQGERHGVRRLRQTLQAKGLDPALVDRALQQARETELERAREVWRRRYGVPADGAAELARQMRFLAGRGFEADVIRSVVGVVDAD